MCIVHDQILKRIEEEKLIAILRGLTPQESIQTALALYEGGIRLIEVTFNQRQAESFDETTEAIRGICEASHGNMEVGAGTVTSLQMVRLAKNAGAQFIISPNTDQEVIFETKKLGMVSIPGAMTPSEAVTAHKAGADFVKLFPAGTLGPEYLKAVRSPLSHIKFMAVGGVNQHNIPDFVAAGACGVGVGGCLVNRDWIKEGRFDRLAALAAEYCKAMKT